MFVVSMVVVFITIIRSSSDMHCSNHNHFDQASGKLKTSCGERGDTVDDSDNVADTGDTNVFFLHYRVSSHLPSFLMLHPASL